MAARLKDGVTDSAALAPVRLRACAPPLRCPMRYTTYSKYHPELADAVNLQSLLDQLSDFLLQSGFAGGSPSFWHDEGGEGERSLEALRQAILQALMDSGQLTHDM